MVRWHPLNRALALGAKVMLGGMLLLCKGRPGGNELVGRDALPVPRRSGVRLPGELSPRWKLRGLRDKYILRKMAERWVPKEIAWRRKAMFRAPMDTFHLEGAPAFFEQLLSAEALRKTGYFDPAAVRHWRTALLHMRHGSYPRTAVEMGLMGVTATQLWHQTFIDPTLADVPEKAHPLQRVGLGGAA